MAKRKSKAEREKEAKEALRRRLADLAAGAYGGYTPPDWENEGEFGGMAGVMGLAAFGRWVGAIGNALLDDEKRFLLEPRYLEHYDYLSKATELL